MSLPTYIEFYKDKNFLDKVFINVGWGWFMSEDALARELYEQHVSFPEDYDKVIIYGNEFTKDEIDTIINEYGIYSETCRIYNGKMRKIFKDKKL